ncbi:MAG TPA: 2-dehydropantoate 2-reductase N-terminal domain-containing protein [Kofleriaceae bacterium]|nr:2-dehydropantoate 2-reductase N-terminal domain-containing protein [Kofleriaceae bacterium]
MRALIVGAGAVGQVFGYHLARGGADVTFLVKPKYVDECRRGFTLFPLDESGHPAHRFEGADVVTEPDGAWDQIYLTVSSTALRAGTWLAELARATGDATIVKLQPGLADREHVVACGVAPARIVDGTINFLSYHAPLPGETRFAEPGMAYWLFPGKAPFSGEDARVRAVVDALVAGELPARVVPDVARTSAFPSAILGMFVAALEAAGWSFAAMRARGLTTLGAHAARDAIAVVGRELGVRPPLAMRLAAHPLMFRALLRVAPRVTPVDLETYLRVHFTKVGDQMHEGMALYLDRARRDGLAVPALEQLARQLPS